MALPLPEPDGPARASACGAGAKTRGGVLVAASRRMPSVLRWWRPGRAGAALPLVHARMEVGAMVYVW